MNTPRDGVSILIVDDEGLVRRSIEAILRSVACQLLVAADGEEALRLLRAHEGPIDLLLSDIDMPGIDGITLARQVLEERPETRVLLISGKASPPPHIRLPFLAKPFRGELLRKTVAAVVCGPRHSMTDLAAG